MLQFPELEFFPFDNLQQVLVPVCGVDIAWQAVMSVVSSRAGGKEKCR